MVRFLRPVSALVSAFFWPSILGLAIYVLASIAVFLSVPFGVSLTAIFAVPSWLGGALFPFLFIIEAPTPNNFEQVPLFLHPLGSTILQWGLLGLINVGICSGLPSLKPRLGAAIVVFVFISISLSVLAFFRPEMAHIKT